MRTRSDVGTLRIAVLASLGIISCGQVADSDDEAGATGGRTGGTGSTTTTTGGATGGGGTGGKAWPPLSEGADIILPKGFVQTPAGVVHRPTITDEACPNIPFPTPDVSSIGDGGLPTCDEKPYGHAWVNSGGCSTACCGLPFGGAPSPPSVGCFYGCVTDSDCEPDSICFCGTNIGTCIKATCRSDADCGEGSVCAEGSEISCRPFNCRVSADCTPGNECLGGECAAYGNECRQDSDCAEDYSKICTLGKCGPRMTCGRPFLVGGGERLSEAVSRTDYACSETLARASLSSLTADDRARLARHWTEVGLMEHASVAAFARFTLQLLALGAPANLVDGAQRALADELVHARLAFGLASAYAGAPIGPGPLAMDGAFANGGFLDVVRTAFLEACVGEAVAAVEAMASRDVATEPGVVNALTRIAEDESRHAALGFEFVQWALGAASDGERLSLTQFMREHTAALAAARNGQDGRNVAATARGVPCGGLLSDAERRAARHRAVVDVVVPCVRVLLAPYEGEGREGTRELTLTRVARPG